MKKIALILGLYFLIAGSVYGDWKEDLNTLLDLGNSGKTEKLIKKIGKEAPDWQKVYQMLQDRSYGKKKADEFVLRKNLCMDDVERPWVMYVPAGYDPSRETPLMIVLHGGVSRKELKKNPLEYAKKNYFVEVARKEGWFLLFPFGQGGATWWDEVGMENIASQIKTMKKEYNIDDDRVWLQGFSDGASAAFLYAMVNPTPFASFVALNGHMGVGSLDGELETYAVNYSNSDIYAVTTDKDGLYPTSKMRETLEMALTTGANILYRNLSGKHDFSYAKTEIPRITTFIKDHSRERLPAKIVWESSSRRFGRCKWLRIDSVALEAKSPWHNDYNTMMSDSRITVGFFPDQEFKGKGIRIGGLAKSETLAKKCRLKEGDILIDADEVKIVKMDDLSTWKKNVSRGDPVVLKVLRAGKEIELKGSLPEVENYYLFSRKAPSGRIDAVFAGNRFMLATSRVGGFTLFIHPDQVNLDKEVEVMVNGKMILRLIFRRITKTNSKKAC